MKVEKRTSQSKVKGSNEQLAETQKIFNIARVRQYDIKYLLSLHPLCGGVFAESARRRHLFLLSLENPYSDYFQIFAVCILALGNLSE